MGITQGAVHAFPDRERTSTAGGSPAETEKERTDRQFGELMAELRVALPGAQVLLGFLLTVPFATRFGRTTRFDRSTLFVSLLFTVTGTVLLMAPSVHHRLRWRQGGKSDVVRMAHRFFLAGSSCLGAGIVSALLLVGDVLFGLTVAVVFSAVVAGIVALAWYAVPMTRSGNATVGHLE